jgi:hypothetical protein
MPKALSLAIDTVQNKSVQKLKSASALQFSKQHGGATESTVQAVLEQMQISQHTILD